MQAVVTLPKPPWLMPSHLPAAFVLNVDPEEAAILISPEFVVLAVELPNSAAEAWVKRASLGRCYVSKEGRYRRRKLCLSRAASVDKVWSVILR
jgi:hypothetical protein